MRYVANIKPSALRVLRGLPKEVRCCLGGIINGLQVNPRCDGVEALEGFNPTRYKYRKGNYRVVFEIHEAKKEISVLKAGDRKEVYR